MHLPRASLGLSCAIIGNLDHGGRLGLRAAAGGRALWLQLRDACASRTKRVIVDRVNRRCGSAGNKGCSSFWLEDYLNLADGTGHDFRYLLFVKSVADS